MRAVHDKPPWAMGNGAALNHAALAVQAAGASPALDKDRLSPAKPSAASKGSRSSPTGKRQGRRRGFGRWSVRGSSRSPKCNADDGLKCVGPQRHCKALESERIPSRSIRCVSRFSELYSIGGEVAKLSRRGTSIRHAVRCSDGLKVVVKVRERHRVENELVCGSFQGPEDEAEWRATMERLLSLPRHESIAYCHEVLEDAKRYYVVMDRAMGLDLFEVLSREGELVAVEVQETLRQILSAVAALHSQGCIHKDLKLENVMLERSHAAAGFVVKLIDFDTLTNWTRDGMLAADVLGTDQYIAPEAYQGIYSPASDMFAIGVLAYRLLSGSFPFDNSIFDDEPGENWVGAPKMEAICESLLRAEINWDFEIFQREPGALDFCQRALSMDHMGRPTVWQALHHPWLTPNSSSSCKDGRAMKQPTCSQAWAKCIEPAPQEDAHVSSLRPSCIGEAFEMPLAPPPPEGPLFTLLRPPSITKAFDKPPVPAPPDDECVMLLPGCVDDMETLE